MDLRKLSVILVFVIVTLTTHRQCEAGIVQELLRTVIQGGLAGFPLVHQEQNFDFDPEISQKRRELYYEVNGYRGEKYMERIGLGIDGRQEERREQQMARDYGRLNGVIYSAPFRNPMLKLEQ